MSPTSSSDRPRPQPSSITKDAGRDRVRIFDTTLRDGEQAPRCSMTRSEKLDVARQLAALGVDIIEAGFPAASPGEVDAVQAIAREVGTENGPVICGLSRANTRDIDTCFRAIEPAAKRRIHTFIATSDIHLEHKLRMSRTQVVEATRIAVAHAKSLCDDVEFSAEDASRSDPYYLCEVLVAAVEAGATTINVPDTVGYATPMEYGQLIATVVSAINDSNIIVSTHCHNDLGMAVANTLAGIQAGARQAECTINGLGERAGNASLEEVVMALHTRKAFYGVSTGINTRHITTASKTVSSATGVEMPCNKAIVGANAFAHEAGIHQDGMLKHRDTYEIMHPDLVGASTNLILGKHSGRNAFQQHVRDTFGIALPDHALEEAFARFKVLADEHKHVSDSTLERLVKECYTPTPVAEPTLNA